MTFTPGMPKISVITVSFNQGEFIRDNIESVMAQNYPNFEHIIIDGGSSDNTLEILRCYPHLRWTSEPDRGQTHGLNKGFARASGDIIAWLNSDDWYPAGVFETVAAELRNHPIVMGACDLTDRQGKVTEHVPNYGRSWFDILKHWVFFSSPSQPSIFFRRAVLEEFKRPDGTYLDEDLDYCMDYEFWLRISHRYPLTRWVDQVLSYYRNYDTNKTGGNMPAVYREMSRVFSRFANNVGAHETHFSFVVPVTKIDDALLRTLQSIAGQTLRDFEVLLVDYNEDALAARSLRKEIGKLAASVSNFALRYVRSEHPSPIAAFNRGVHSSCAPLIVWLQPGALVAADLCLESANVFRHDIVGVALAGKHPLSAAFSKEENGVRRFNVEALFTQPLLNTPFIGRKVALIEAGMMQQWRSEVLAVQQLFAHLLYKGWHVHVHNTLGIEQEVRSFSVSEATHRTLLNWVTAEIVESIHEDLQRDRYAQLRAQHGFALVFPDSLVENAKKLLQLAPPHWHRLDFSANRERLEEYRDRYPHFPIDQCAARA